MHYVYVCLYPLCGYALAGIYTVALKKLTPPRLRPLAFAVQYASFNFSGALCDFAIDYLRMREVRKQSFFLRHFHIKTIVLPRQARGKDRETLKRRERVFRRMSC